MGRWAGWRVVKPEGEKKKPIEQSEEAQMEKETRTWLKAVRLNEEMERGEKECSRFAAAKAPSKPQRPANRPEKGVRDIHQDAQGHVVSEEFEPPIVVSQAEQNQQMKTQRKRATKAYHQQAHSPNTARPSPFARKYPRTSSLPLPGASNTTRNENESFRPDIRP